jgi:hypothetical protein
MKKLILIATIFTLSSFSVFAEVNCAKDYNQGGNLVTKADNASIRSYKHDRTHEKFIFQADMEKAKNQLEQAISLANDSVDAFKEAKGLYEGVVDYGCRWKVKRSYKKLNYINWRLEHLEYKITIMNLMNNYL